MVSENRGSLNTQICKHTQKNVSNYLLGLNDRNKNDIIRVD